MGHSWGSFIVQGYIEKYHDIELAGCVISGSRGPDEDAVVIGGSIFLTLLAFFRGGRARSELAHRLADGAYNAFFKPNRTQFDWLSRDEAEVDAYAADPFCGKRVSIQFYKDLAFFLIHIHKKDNMKKIDSSLPVYVFSGGKDPVGNMGTSPTLLVDAYKSNGMKDLEIVIYPDGRHEMLNETNYREVEDNLAAWLNKKIAANQNTNQNK
jgi:alpha-beta hydrolase superfamily lysophospholipase